MKVCGNHTRLHTFSLIHRQDDRSTRLAQEIRNHTVLWGHTQTAIHQENNNV